MRRIIDLTLSIQCDMRGADIKPVRTLEVNGWNAAQLELYSHCGIGQAVPGKRLAHSTAS